MLGSGGLNVSERCAFTDRIRKVEKKQYGFEANIIYWRIFICTYKLY